MPKPYISANGKRLQAAASPLTAALNRKFGNRLVKLHALLSAMPASQYRHVSLVTKVVSVGPTPPPVHACGSVACAFGHAVISGKFRDIPVLVDWGDSDGDGIYDNVSFGGKDNRASGNALLDMLGDHAADMYPDYTYDGDVIIAQVEYDNIEIAADSYFGPGAWEGIFGTNYTSPNPAKRTVLGRIKNIAEKCYGVSVKA